MRLFSPWALWFLLFMPLVVLMYMLRQKPEERIIGSIYLWQQVLKDIEVNTPWQKLKKNMLLFLQLLSILFLVFALSDPYLNTGAGGYSNLIIVLDNTGSMNAAYEGNTRLEAARQMAEDLVSQSGANANITLVTVERNPRVEIGNTTDKGEVIKRIKAVKPGNSYGNINDSVSLVRAMVKQYEGGSGYKAVFYTDSPVDTEDLNAEVVSLASRITNASLDYISYSGDNASMTVLIRVTNRSDRPLSREVSLYGGDRVLGIKSIQLPEGETGALYFEVIDTNVPYIWAELTEKDDLEQDNRVYGIIKSAVPVRVLMASTGNVFIEKALASIEGIELYKTSPDEGIDEGYDLYIFDSAVPKAMPGSGSLLLVNPPEGNEIVESGAEIQGGTAEVVMHSITRYMENADFTVSKLRSIEAPLWSEVLIRVNGNTAALCGEYMGRKAAVIGFDLHDSDFALTAEFPVFMYKLTSYLTGIDSEENFTYLCGDSVELKVDPEAEEAVVRTPEGDIYRQELAYPLLPFEKTGQMGIYELSQKVGDMEKLSSFAVNFPVESESSGSGEVKPETRQEAGAAAGSGGIRLREWLLALLLLAVASEWVVYIRGC